jgi:hypothetical protein
VTELSSPPITLAGAVLDSIIPGMGVTFLSPTLFAFGDGMGADIAMCATLQILPDLQNLEKA